MKYVYFFLLFLIVPIIFIYVSNYRKNIKFIRTLDTRGNDYSRQFFYKYFLMSIFFILFIFFSVWSLVGISWGKFYEVREETTLDVAFVLDVSNSMNGDDIRPSRLKKSIAVAQALIVDSPNIRYSVTVFKGKAFVVVPMTSDFDSVRYGLENLSTDMISVAGTNIKDGVKEAFYSFPKDKESKKKMFIFSDGGNKNFNFNDKFLLDLKKEVEVNTIFVGLDSDVYLKNNSGEIVYYEDSPVNISLNKKVLESFSKSVEGKSFFITDSFVISKLRNSIINDYNKLGKENYIEKEDDKYYWLLFVALCFLFLQNFVKVFMWKKRF